MISYHNYIHIYSEVDKDRRAKESIGILIKDKYKNQIENWKYVSKKMLVLYTNTGHEKLNIIAAYAPEDVNHW